MSEFEKISQAFLSDTLSIEQWVRSVDALREKQMKKSGVVYTPWHVVQKMCVLLDPKEEQSVIEPSVGHGIFVFGLLEWMRTVKKLGQKRLFDYALKKIHALDIDEQSVQELRQMLCVYVQKYCAQKVCSNIWVNIKSGDGLDVQKHFDAKIAFDVCIGNPPYVRTKHLDAKYLGLLRERFKSCKKGNVDLYYAFIECYQNPQIAKQMCLIVPNGFLSNTSGAMLMQMLENKWVHLMNFEDQLIFPNARTYTCIMHVSNQTPKRAVDPSRWSLCNGAPVDWSVLSVEHKEVDQKSYWYSGAKGTFELRVQGARTKKAKKTKLVLSGIATLADKVYEVFKDQNGYYGMIEGTRYDIESTYVVPYLKITKYASAKSGKSQYMLYPYDEKKTLIGQEQWMQNAPKAWSYLQACAARLAKRDKGKTDKYESWYAYGRKQGLHQVDAKEVVIVPALIGGLCVPKKINWSQLKGSSSAVVFTSGYVVPLSETIKQACAYLLSDAFLKDLEKVGKAWAGKDAPYYAISALQLEQLISTYVQKEKQ